MKKAFWKKPKLVLSFLIFGLTTPLVLAACGRSGGPVTRLVETTLFYKTKNQASQVVNNEYKLWTNYGDPENVSEYLFTDQNDTNKRVKLGELKNPLSIVQANFFSNLISGALKYQKYALVARANLLRNYYTYVNDQNNQVTAVLSDANAIQKYLGEPEALKKLNQATPAAAKQFLDYQFSFAEANVLNQGNGFAGGSPGIKFEVRSIYFDLGNLENIEFVTNQKGDQAFIKFTDPANTITNQTVTTLNVNNQPQELVRFNIQKSIYNYGFRLDNTGQYTEDPEVINNYFKISGNSNLIPPTLQHFQSTDFNVHLANYALWANVIKPVQQEGISSADAPEKILTNPNPNNLGWNNLVNQTKFYDDSLVKLSQELNPNKFFNPTSRVLIQNTYGYYIDQKVFFPNNRVINDFRQEIKAFNDGSENTFNWSGIRQLQVNDLLFSLFPDFEFSNNFDTVVAKSNAENWLSQTTVEETKNKIING
ncbi:hypothetical protein J2Z62_000656 [Mycoplasmoides fastidiosum]|uniref:Lipoprotein n=1 Tax=Mycoplasmoides fastidiosum TaxID=92758 RepID=A0ABU0LZW0_9BACT|nr:hypothetical protein [Mycoplasmoides fastidiosum]MDQ0514218.1 hypothetical protein [Mycoplasmoides fastidiosum]UUD37374.1 hypothetical protein NPA10_02200 [Mycoplasmoides fastidiosum]